MQINLVLQSSQVFIFDQKECAYLREKYHLIGDLTGSFNDVPNLPLKLFPEEVAFLLEKNIGKIVMFKNEQKSLLQHQTELLEEQKLLYKESRKKQLENIFPTVVASKRLKGDIRTESEIFEEELEKSSQVTADKMIWPILLKNENSVYEEQIYDVYKHTTPLRYKVFKDLWQKGYYITSGQKFGGDFLAYLGDPILYHAIFIIRCVETITKPMKSLELVAFGRLGTSVKKKSILAGIVDGIVSYVTINWIDD